MQSPGLAKVSKNPRKPRRICWYINEAIILTHHLLALFFLPLFRPLQSLEFAYGPALIAVGILMFASVKRIDFDDMTESVPAVITVVMMAFTYNIANGLTAGLVLHPVLKTAAGRWSEVHAGGWVLGVACLVYFLFGAVH